MRVEFAEHFRERLRNLHLFMRAQDLASAPSRAEALREDVVGFIDLVKLHPEIGRPVDQLDTQTAEGQRRIRRVLQLALEAGLPHLREYVLRAHVLLYAQSDSHILVLSIRHQRELGYVPETVARMARTLVRTP